VVPIDRAQRRVDVDERALGEAGPQRHPLPERHQMRPTYRGELVGVAEGELAQGDPSAPLSARIIAAMIEVSFLAGLTAPDLTRVDSRSTCSPIRLERPVCSASFQHRRQPGRRH
jgi:hypothetical protein